MPHPSHHPPPSPALRGRSAAPSPPAGADDPRVVRYKIVAFGSMAACTLGALGLWWISGLPVHRHVVFQKYVALTAVMAVLAAGTTLARARLSHRVELPLLAVALRELPEILQILVFLYWVPGMITIADYLVVSFPRPLVDGWLAAPEQALGLTHPVSFAWFRDRGWVDAFLWIYGVVEPEVKLFGAWALLVRRDWLRPWQYTATLAAAGVASIPMLWLFPAAGPTAFYAGQYPVLPPALSYLDTLDALRAGHLASLERVEGLLACPSFHTVFALTLTRAWQDAPRPVYWGFAVLNGLVVVSTIPVGSHYVVDIVGGIAWTALFAWGVDRISRGRA